MSRTELALLAAITFAGAYLRFDRLAQPSMWLDEILSYEVATKASHQPLWHWLIAAFEPEHGPLFHALLLLGRLSHSPEWSVRVIAAICGTAAIPVVWTAARNCSGAVAGIAAAALLAVSPLSVYYSRDGRPYAMLMLLSAAILAEVTGDLAERARRAEARRAPGARFVVIAVLVLACAYTSATATPLLIAFALCAATGAITSTGDERKVWMGNALAAAGGIGVMALLYRSHTPDVSVTVAPRLDPLLLLRSLSVTALQPSESRIAYLVLALMIAGAIAVAMRDRTRATLLIGLTVLTASGAWLAVAWFHHSFEVRYICPALPPYLVLAAIGAAEVGRWLARFARKEAAQRALAATIACGLVAPALIAAMPAARSEAFRKLDWRLIAHTIWQHSAPGDMVIAANDWSAVSLDFYMQRLPARVRVVAAHESTSTMERLLNTAPSAWIVSAAHYRTTVLPGWLCRYPLLLASPTESFGLHYAPSRSHFLRFRASPDERRAVTAPFEHAPFSLTFGDDDATFLGDGWAGRERIGGDDVRWAIGTEAKVFLPFDARSAHRMRIRIMPFAARGLGPQRVHIDAGDAVLREVTLQPGWNDVEVAVPAGASPVFRFRFDRANAPSAFDSASSDHRALAALFTEIYVDTTIAVPVGPFGFSIALQDVEWMSASEVRKTQFGPSTFRPEALRALAGRCGFSPDHAVPRLLAGNLKIEDLAQSVLDRGGCFDNQDFVRNAYWSIIGRSVTEEDAKTIVKSWTNAAARRRLVQGLIESSEFRERMTTH